MAMQHATNRPNAFAEALKLRERPIAVGAWCSLPGALNVELIASAGFDWLGIDLQHGAIDTLMAVSMLQAASISGTPTILRTASLDDAEIGRVLDAGAAGVIVPMINTADEARALVEASRYPPQGRRSWGPTRPLMTVPGYSPETANRRTICGVQIETAQALGNLDEIFAVEGVDFAMVGPYDLAINLGISPGPGIINAAHRDAIKSIADACHRHGVVPAIYGPNARAAMEFLPLGYTALTIVHDTALLSSFARKEAETGRAAIAALPKHSV